MRQFTALVTREKALTARALAAPAVARVLLRRHPGFRLPRRARRLLAARRWQALVRDSPRRPTLVREPRQVAAAA